MNPPPPGYKVSISAATRELLTRLHQEAAGDGQRNQFLTALRTIFERLRTEPAILGEALFDLRELRFTVRLGVLLPLAVEFGVSPEQGIVFVRTFRYIPPA
jgi:hypothetical protein